MSAVSRKLTKKVVALSVLAAGITVAVPGSMAFANYTTQTQDGQFVGKDGLNCGGQEILGVSGPYGSVQHSWVYYNCSSGSLRRYADVINDFDGTCYGIGPGQARVLHQKFTWFDAYRGSKDC